MQHSSTPWWMTETYDGDTPLPTLSANWLGPKGIALVRAFPDGRTDSGWGLRASDPRYPDRRFMPKYLHGDFNDRKALYGYERDKWVFAIVMRSIRLVCIDIDGKNGGLEHAKQLGPLPPTLAETSKSGNGYHLFYDVDDVWVDEELDAQGRPIKGGFCLLGDRIGIEQGVDFRATGCVYHHKTQRWNHRMPAKLPDYLVEMFKSREQKLVAANDRILKILSNNDDMEVLMMHDEIISELNKPMQEGKRNQTLFAIGSRMATAQVPDWENLLVQRAEQVGLPCEEAEKLVFNINRYALTAVP